MLSLNKLSVDDDILDLFKLVFETYGFDIGRYKPAFMKRRIDRRMRLLEITEYSEYALVLKKEKSEFEELFVSLSINVTNFFRDFTVYDKFRLHIIPKILSGLNQQNKIRIWSAGCASGEEAYSLAILFMHETSKLGSYKIEIIANDISEKAVGFAQNGRYTTKSIEKLPNDMIAANFHKVINEENNVEYELIPTIKNLISFKVCDILSSDVKQLDVIFCRNVLIYYEREAQELIISKFYHSLKDSGYLVLGMDETMLGRRCEKLFHPLMARERIYQKI